jgi:CubicO group peptidase (beta-lactamase class C family)
MTYVSPMSVELAAPESVGIDPRRLRLFLDRVRLEVDEGEKIYGGSDEVANLDLFCTVSGEIGGPWTPRTGSAATFGNGGVPCQLGFMDPETGTSLAFLTNGYPLAGYDYSARGRNLRINIGNLGNDLIG